MKKSLIALAVMAAAGAASAQSSVTLFGIVDATINRTSTSGFGSSHVSRLTNSGYNSSRLGFRGTEDLGGGMSASFWLEAGVNNDNGTGSGTNVQNQAPGTSVGGSQGLTFNRRSTVSLAGGWGELRLGRDYVPSFWNMTVFDPFGTNGVGTNLMLAGPASGLGVAANAMVPYSQGTGGVLVRASNQIGYFLPPNLGGIYGQVGYWFGENLSGSAANNLTGDTAVYNSGSRHKDGTGYGARLGYGSGPFNVAVSYGRTHYFTAPNTSATVATSSAALGDYQVWNIGGQWDFGMAKAMAQYSRDERKNPGSHLVGKGWLVGALVPVGAGEIRASYSTYDLGTPEAKQLALGYVHNLSKRTAVYATVSRIKNDGGARQNFGSGSATFGTGVVNQNATGWDLGVRHSF